MGNRKFSWHAATPVLLICAALPLLGQTAALQVIIGGLPNGISAQVLISGASGYQEALTGTTLLTGLAPGAFSVSAGLILPSTGGLYVSKRLSRNLGSGFDHPNRYRYCRISANHAGLATLRPNFDSGL